MRKVICFLVGVLAFFVLPLLSWGISDISVFFGNRCRLLYAVFMVFASLLVVLFVPNEGRGVGKGDQTLERARWSLPAIQVLTLVLLLVPPYLDRHQIGVFPRGEALRIAGLLLVVAGFFLMNWSVVALGRQFSVAVTVQRGHRLVTEGPYRVIRHPRYLGILVFLTGVTLVFSAWVTLGAVLLLSWVLLRRIRVEEDLMRATFQAEWDEYQKRTYCLIPWIY